MCDKKLKKIGKITVLVVYDQDQEGVLVAKKQESDVGFKDIFDSALSEMTDIQRKLGDLCAIRTAKLNRLDG